MAGESEQSVVICELCGDAEVNDPALDYCHVCDKKICDDCVAQTNEEHGLLFCHECVAKEKASIEDFSKED